MTHDGLFPDWVIVELMGHRRVAGYVQEVQIAGAGFLRLDIPESGDDPGRTQYVPPGSVYAMHPVSEETARAAAAQWRPEPVQRWEVPAAAWEVQREQQAEADADEQAEALLEVGEMFP